MKKVATSRSSRSSEPPTWLVEVYEHRRRRTVRLVELSIAVLARASERVSLAAITRVSKVVDPADPDGISESALLHNEEAYAAYRRHAEHKPQAHRKPSPERRTNTADNNRIRVSAERDRGRARQRYLRAGKADLVDRLLSVEQAYADMEDRWLRTADDLLVWMMLFDRLFATTGQHGSNRYEAPFLTVPRTALDGPADIGTKRRRSAPISSVCWQRMRFWILATSSSNASASR